jgi:hypothetical protein
VGNGENLHRRFLFAIDNQIGKLLQYKLSGAVEIFWPRVWPVRNVFKPVIDGGEKIDSSFRVSLTIPVFGSLELGPCLGDENGKAYLPALDKRAIRRRRTSS